MADIIKQLGGPWAVIADAVRRLPRRLPEDEISPPALELAIEYRLLRAFALCDGVRWADTEDVATALYADSGFPDGCYLLGVELARQLLADATICYMPDVPPRVSGDLQSAISAVREGLHLWRDSQQESAERRLTRGLMQLLAVDATTSEATRLAYDVSARALEYIADDLGTVTPAGIMALMRDVSERRGEWHDAAEVNT